MLNLAKKIYCSARKKIWIKFAFKKCPRHLSLAYHVGIDDDQSPSELAQTESH